MTQTKKTITLGLIPKLIIAIVLGIIVGAYLPETLGGFALRQTVTAIAVTVSQNFGKLLNFIIPLMVLAFVTSGISDLAEGAGKLLLVAVGLAYISTLIAGSASYLMASSLFGNFISPDMANQVQTATSTNLEAYFLIPLSPVIDVTGALVLAFIMGLCISVLRQRGSGEYLYNLVSEFTESINMVLSKVIIPFLPFYIFGNFANMAYSGSVFVILSIFVKIFICIIALHLLYLLFLFVVGGTYTGRNPFKSLKIASKAYITAIGTQSSAATIPVNVECNREIGVTKQIREFVIPLAATVHMPGSMITITACVFTILTMFGMDTSFLLIMKLVATLGIAMVAAPGAPGGAVMSALPFLPLVGIATDSPLASILITLYLTQDSFGTAANVTGDNAISMIVEKIYYNRIVKRPIPKEDI